MTTASRRTWNYAGNGLRLGRAYDNLEAAVAAEVLEDDAVALLLHGLVHEAHDLQLHQFFIVALHVSLILCRFRGISPGRACK